MARPQRTINQMSGYPRRGRATPVPSYSDITDASRSATPASDDVDSDIDISRQTSRYPQRRQATRVLSHSDITNVSRSPSPAPEQNRSRYPRRATLAASYSNITELSRSPSPPSDFYATGVDKELTPEPWPKTTSTSEVFRGSQSPTPSDASDDIVIVRPASPPPGFAHMSENGLRASRRASYASTEISTLTWLSRTPSRPSGLGMTLAELAEAKVETADVSEEDTSEEDESEEEISDEEVIEEAVVQHRGANGRFVTKRTRTQTSSSDERPANKAKTPAASHPIKKIIPLSSRTAPAPSTPEATPNGGSLGNLANFPQEIRQSICAYALDIARPITNRQCCGPESTKRERDVCKKHGKTVETDSGRFSLLQVSKEVSEEALWVLYNQGSLKLELGKELRPYFAKYRPKSSHRLGEIPHAKKAKAMWMTAARYRFVELAVTSQVMRLENPEEYTAHLCEIASLFLKGWETEVYQPTAEIPHTVTISLGELFEEIIPFNAIPDPDINGELYLWSLINFPGQEPDFVKIATNSGKNFMRLISIVSQNRGLSEWRMVALAEIDKDSEGYKWLQGVRKECWRSGMTFEDLTREEMGLE